MKCLICRNVAYENRSVQCGDCLLFAHLTCIGLKELEFTFIRRLEKAWYCGECQASSFQRRPTFRRPAAERYKRVVIANKKSPLLDNPEDEPAEPSQALKADASDQITSGGSAEPKTPSVTPVQKRAERKKPTETPIQNASEPKEKPSRTLAPNVSGSRKKVGTPAQNSEKISKPPRLVIERNEKVSEPSNQSAAKVVSESKTPPGTTVSYDASEAKKPRGTSVQNESKILKPPRASVQKNMRVTKSSQPLKSDVPNQITPESTSEPKPAAGAPAQSSLKRKKSPAPQPPLSPSKTPLQNNNNSKAINSKVSNNDSSNSKSSTAQVPTVTKSSGVKNATLKRRQPVQRKQIGTAQPSKESVSTSSNPKSVAFDRAKASSDKSNQNSTNDHGKGPNTNKAEEPPFLKKLNSLKPVEPKLRRWASDYVMSNHVRNVNEVNERGIQNMNLGDSNINSSPELDQNAGGNHGTTLLRKTSRQVSTISPRPKSFDERSQEEDLPLFIKKLKSLRPVNEDKRISTHSTAVALEPPWARLVKRSISEQVANNIKSSETDEYTGVGSNKKSEVFRHSSSDSIIVARKTSISGSTPLLNAARVSATNGKVSSYSQFLKSYSRKLQNKESSSGRMTGQTQETRVSEANRRIDLTKPGGGVEIQSFTKNNSEDGCKLSKNAKEIESVGENSVDLKGNRKTDLNDLKLTKTNGTAEPKDVKVAVTNGLVEPKDEGVSKTKQQQPISRRKTESALLNKAAESSNDRSVLQWMLYVSKGGIDILDSVDSELGDQTDEFTGSSDGNFCKAEVENGLTSVCGEVITTPNEDVSDSVQGLLNVEGENQKKRDSFVRRHTESALSAMSSDIRVVNDHSLFSWAHEVSKGGLGILKSFNGNVEGESADAEQSPEPEHKVHDEAKNAAAEKDQEIKRGHILAELLETERIYVSELESIVKGYKLPVLAEETRHLNPELDGKCDVIFGNLEELYTFHNDIFLQDLENCISTTELVALCFTHRKDVLHKLYSSYCQNTPRSERLRESIGDHPFLRSCQTKLGHKLPLAAYLLKPVQRITKYRLLLEDLLSHSEGKKWCCELQEALDCMLVVLKCVNDSMHQTAITGFWGDLGDLGDLLMQGGFSVWTESKKDRFKKELRLMKLMQRHLFLYQKAILFCKKTPIHSKANYHFKRLIKMSDVGLTETVKDGKTFEIWLPGRSEVHTIQAATVEQKTEWVDQIKSLLLLQLTQLKLKQHSKAGSRSMSLDHHQGRGSPRALSCDDGRSKAAPSDEDVASSSDFSNSDDEETFISQNHDSNITVLNSSHGSRYRALADYTPFGHNELPMKEGDLVTLLKVGCAGWWYVRLYGAGEGVRKEGWAPAAYLEHCSRKTSRSAQSVTSDTSSH